MAKLVSKTYGEALYELAMEEKKTRDLLQEIQAVQEVLAQNPDFDKLLKHPGIPKQEKLQVMRTVFGGRVSDTLAGFLEIVISKERYGDLGAIFSYFIAKVKEEEKIGIAYVTTAVTLNAQQKESVCARLLETSAYETMEMHYSVDETLIGGMVIRINDRVVDSSIRTRLNHLTKQLLM